MFSQVKYKSLHSSLMTVGTSAFINFRRQRLLESSCPRLRKQHPDSSRAKTEVPHSITNKYAKIFMILICQLQSNYHTSLSNPAFLSPPWWAAYSLEITSVALTPAFSARVLGMISRDSANFWIAYCSSPAQVCVKNITLQLITLDTTRYDHYNR